MNSIPDSDAPSWPPAYAVRVSQRAKYPRLRVLPGKGLEVVLPRTMDPKTASNIVERHKEWIRKTLDRVCGPGAEKEPPAVVPEWFSLRGGMDKRRVLCRGETVPENAGNAEPAVKLRSLRVETTAASRELQEWTRKHAARVLGEEAALLAEKHGLPFSALRFRRQKSRWGSCTVKKTLSLNTCLIFLPPELARHIILHELAHTRHMDHGQGFWKTLFAMEPDAVALDRRLRAAWRFVPAWMWV